MAFRFRRQDRSVERAVHRIAREQIDKIVASIDNCAEDWPTAVHDVRRRCKKVRGLIRLVRPAFEDYADENADFRDVARQLGSLREASVLQATYDGLVRSSEPIDPESRLRFKQGLKVHQHAHDGAEPAERLAEARERLMLARQRVGEWTLAADGWPAIGPGLMLTYMRARTALERIGTSHAPGRFHELRKRVKYHWHHMRLLRPVHPKEIAERFDLAGELGDRLGEHHDLAMLEAALRRDPDAFVSGPDVAAVRALARRQRAPIEEECLRMARRLLAESAESLTERLGERWEDWRD